MLPTTTIVTSVSVAYGLDATAIAGRSRETSEPRFVAAMLGHDLGASWRDLGRDLDADPSALCRGVRALRRRASWDLRVQERVRGACRVLCAESTGALPVAC